MVHTYTHMQALKLCGVSTKIRSETGKRDKEEGEESRSDARKEKKERQDAEKG